MRLLDPSRHLFEVELRLDRPDAQQRVQMPSWIPGSYLLREFARHVVSIRAESGGRPVDAVQAAKGTWVFRGAADELVVTIEVHALDPSIRGAYFTRERAYFNGTSLFLQPDGRDDEPVELELEPPRDQSFAGWRVATAMQPAEIDDRGFGRYRAASYDELIDHPFEIGHFERVDFVAAGVPHRLVVSGRFDTDLERVAADLARLCTTQIEFFGGAPFDRYWFLGHAIGDGYGGLEHSASSSLLFDRDDLPKRGESGVPADYQRFLSLASHEYFHAWHIKRTKPAAFLPYRLDRRNHTRLLWVFEGITSYYQDLFVRRSGLIDRDVYLKRLGQTLTRAYRTPGRFRQTLADASFNAWDVLYKPEPNALNTSVNYYVKGAVVALALDLELRRRSSSSLDDVVRELWRRYGAVGIGVPEDGFERLAEEVAGVELGEFFERAIRSTQELPLGDLLAAFGIELVLRPQLGLDDRGGAPPQRDAAPLPTLGATYRARPDGVELTAVLDSGPAQHAGLVPGDVLVALDRLKVNERNLRRRLARCEAGQRVTAAVFRGDRLLEVDLVLGEAPADTCWLRVVAEAGPAAVARRDAWLGE